MTRHYDTAAVRASLLHFLFGKAFNAVVSVVTLVALARWLTAGEYGSYVALLALQATLLAVSNLGIETTAERFLPEFRSRYEDGQLLGFVLGGVLLRCATLVVLAGLGIWLAKPLSSLVGLPQLHGVLRVWMLGVALFGAFSFACVLLEAMLKQKLAQACMSVYLGTKLALIMGLHLAWQIDLDRLVLCELVASGVAGVLALTALTRHFERSGLREGWRLVQDNRDRLRRFAAFNYAAQCVFQLFSADMLKLLVTRLVGVAGAATYGFAASLADMVQRYLPATLLQRMIKPVFVSRYVKSGDFSELNQLARIILKLNLLLLVPAIGLATAYGADLLSLLTGGKYTDAHWLLIGALCLLVLSSHQAILSLLAGTLERNAMQLYAGMCSGIAFPVAYQLIPRWGPLGAVAAAALSALVYNTVATIYLRRAGFDYRPDWRAFGVFALGGAVLMGGLLLCKSWVTWRPASVAVTLILLAAYLLVVRLMSAFSAAERSTLNAILPKPVFIF